MKEGKSFEISRHQVLEAYKRVKANRGAGGIDGVNFAEFDKDLKNNLYKNLESNVIRELLPKSGQGRGNTEEKRKNEVARYSNYSG